ncbi:hypothetical protein [Polynucleobacter sp. KF022]|uniref:hypothetical protein n=1 Tax=Polynucleobacter sp. KF022 TaxID=2982615 RepID=UPI0023778A41|nr:hypothetical protein [Polynucleobacter sp. KF022]BDT74872.1 hypothetical protein PKF022_05370 [Polynucleobacter sp. KF022]
MNSKEINKTLNKAHDFTNAILKEMSETYPPEQIPYFLHIWLLQAAHGLVHHGFKPEDVNDLISAELEPYKGLTFDLVTELLPQPRSKALEAFEFRFLFSENDAVDKVIYVEADDKAKMIRLTFPMAAKNGRGRIWLKRGEFTHINEQDISDFVAIIEKLRDAGNLGVLITPQAHKMIVGCIGTAELFDHGAVVVGKRGSAK